MRRLLVILLVSWVYVGCATAPTPPETLPHSGGRVRLLPSSPAQAVAIGDAITAGRLAPDGLLRPAGGKQEGCVSFRLVGPAVYPDGQIVDAGSVIAEWEAALRRGDGPATWLLGPVTGLDVEADDRLRICSGRRTPDWSARLAHPALWLRGADRTRDRSAGPGPFRRSGEPGVLTASPLASDDRALLDAIEIVEPGAKDPALLFELGAVDLAVVSGRDAGSLLDAPDAALRVERVAQWDTVYALWFGARARWVNDPRFRAWVASAVDRDAMLRFLFDGRGEPAFRLTPGGGPEWIEPPSRPFSAGSAPRLELIFDSADTEATSVASRLKAVLEQEGLSIRLEPASGDRLREATAEEGFQLALVAHHPPVRDPVLALQHTLWTLGNPMVEAWESLERAAWWEDDERRTSAALFAEDTLLRQARLVPLVRVHAWLVAREGLEGVVAGPWGVLQLERARWAQ